MILFAFPVGSMAGEHARDGLQPGSSSRAPATSWCNVRHIHLHPGLEIDVIATGNSPQTSEAGTRCANAAAASIYTGLLRWERQAGGPPATCRRATHSTTAATRPRRIYVRYRPTEVRRGSSGDFEDDIVARIQMRQLLLQFLGILHQQGGICRKRRGARSSRGVPAGKSPGPGEVEPDQQLR